MTDVAQALGSTIESDARITGWSIDSRTVAPGDLFFALRGPNHDGNAYVDEVLRKGAVAAIAHATDSEPGPRGNGVSRCPTRSTRCRTRPSGRFEQWGGEVIGVTGSAGKTSTKDVIAALLASAMPVGKTIGNLNNHVGVPSVDSALAGRGAGRGARNGDESRGRNPRLMRDRQAAHRRGHQRRTRAHGGFRFH